MTAAEDIVETTERLDLRRATLEDVPELFAILSDSRVWTHLPSGRHTAPERTAQSVGTWIAGWRKDGIGTWVVRERDTEEVVGYGGISDLGGVAWNLGYRFAPDVQGHGYATELSRHALDRAQHLSPERAVIAYLLEHNIASAAVARKVGLHLVDRGPDAGNPDPDAVRLVYADRELSAEELAAAHR